MDFSRDMMFSYLEEDNTQRAYFRARPLLSPDMLIHEEALRLWPDHGALRIVPDRNEQHTFKERMRQIGAYCVIDLSRFAPEANKIRTNKNYRPDGSEPNQYIVFSDAVLSLPEHTFLEVLEGRAEDALQKAQQAITPLFYLRTGDTFYGPVRKAAPEVPETAGEMTGKLFDLTSPDGSIHTLFCVRPAVEEASKAEKPPEAPPTRPEEKTVTQEVPQPEAPLPVGKPLQLLDKAQSFEETLEALDQPLSSASNLLKNRPGTGAQPLGAEGTDSTEKLSGTPLYQSALPTSTPRVKNRVQEVVSNQWHAAKNEPPAPPLPEGAKLQEVENPVDKAVQALTNAWRYADTRKQLVGLLLSMEGMNSLVEEQQTGAIRSSSPLQAAMKRHLDMLETERLGLLVQLDQAKADVEEWRKKTLAQVAAKRRAELDNLDKRIDAHQKKLLDLKEQIAQMIELRNQLLDELHTLEPNAFATLLEKLVENRDVHLPATASPLRMTPISGVDVEPDVMIDRLARAAENCGITLHRNTAVCGLALLATCPRVGVAAHNGADSYRLLQRLAAAMGWKDSLNLQVDPNQIPIVYPAPPDPTPAMLVTTLPNRAALDGVCKLMVAEDINAMTRETAYRLDPWPIYPLRFNALSEDFEPTKEPAVSLRSLQQMAERATGSEEDIRRILAPMIELAEPLSDHAYEEILAFVRTASGYMNGGLAAACDWATTLWLLPRFKRDEATQAKLEEVLREYPVSMIFLHG